MKKTLFPTTVIGSLPRPAWLREVILDRKSGQLTEEEAGHENVRLGLGCIDHCDRQVETSETVVARVEKAMRYVDRERITLDPDCGFAPSVQNPMDLDEAYLKLKAMCQAAELLRNRYA